MFYYKVADLVFGIEIPGCVNADETLPNYASFRITELQKEPVFCLECVPYGSLNDLTSNTTSPLASGEGENGAWVVYELPDHYVIDMEYRKGFPQHRLVCDKMFHHCQTALMFEDPFGKLMLSELIFFIYAQVCLQHGASLLHSSVAVKDGIGYAFLGVSGTGKSTHAEQWMKYIPGVERLNDDNPVIRIDDDDHRVYIYGTPWSGKTPCYKNQRALLGGIVKLKQAPYNKVRKLNGMEAYTVLLQSSNLFKWNRSLQILLGGTLEKVVNQVPGLFLEDLPNEEAAWLCYNTFQKLAIQ